MSVISGAYLYVLEKRLTITIFYLLWHVLCLFIKNKLLKFMVNKRPQITYKQSNQAVPIQGTCLNTVSSKQGHDLLLLMHDICFCWASEPWLMFNLSIKFLSDMWILSMLISPTQKSGYIMWCFLQIFTILHGISQPPFFFFSSLCWKEKLFLTMPEALSFIPHQCLSDSKSLSA